MIIRYLDPWGWGFKGLGPSVVMSSFLAFMNGGFIGQIWGIQKGLPGVD